MRKIIAIATFIIVAGLSLFGMSQKVFAYYITQPDFSFHFGSAVFSPGFLAYDASTTQSGTFNQIIIYKDNIVAGKSPYAQTVSLIPYDGHQYTYLTNSIASTTGSVYAYACLYDAVTAQNKSITIPVGGSLHYYSNALSASLYDAWGTNTYKSFHALGYSDDCANELDQDFEEDLTGTRIISFDPSYQEVVSPTSSGMATATFYVNGDEWDSDIRYVGSMFYHSQTTVEPIWLTEYGDEAPGTVPSFNYWTNNELDFSREGKYTWELSICRWEGIWIFRTCSDILVASSTEFWVGSASSSPYYNAQVSLQDHLDQLFASTTYEIYDSCKIFTSGNIVDCFLGLIYPGSDIIAEDFLLIKQVPPWGYAFRFYDILTGNATTSTSTLPSISYTFSTSSPLYVGDGTLTFDPFDTLLDASSIVNATSDQVVQKSLWTIMSPIIALIVYLMLGFIIIKDLTKIR